MSNVQTTSIIEFLTGEGALLYKTKQKRQGSRFGQNTTEVHYLKFQSRFFKVYDGLEDGLVVELSQITENFDEHLMWKSIFTFTVPNFERMTSKEKIDWVISVPKRQEEYPKFLIKHLETFLQGPLL